MKKIVKDALILFIITLIAGVLLGLVYKITKKPIEIQNEKNKLAAYNSVFSDLESYEELTDLEYVQEAVEADDIKGVTINEIVKAFNKDSDSLGYIITITDANGYGGDIKMTVGIDNEGVITGLEFLDINETAGLGMKAKDDAFRNQYKGLSGYVSYTKASDKADNEVDAISSATITTKAVTDGVNGALCAYKVLGGKADE